MKKIVIALSCLVVCISSCDSIKEKTKKTINKSGETVGKTATEFIEGVTEGVDKSLQCELNLSQELLEQGIETGKYSIEDAEGGGDNNQLTLYLIFNKNVETTVIAKVSDKSGIEIGRTKMNIKAEAGEAGYYDFIFDKRTYIEVKSKIQIE